MTMEGKGIYSSCTNCGNTAEGTKILRCNTCSRVFCETCMGPSRDFILGPECPHCKGILITALGDNRYQTLGAIKGR